MQIFCTFHHLQRQLLGFTNVSTYRSGYFNLPTELAILIGELNAFDSVSGVSPGLIIRVFKLSDVDSVYLLVLNNACHLVGNHNLIKGYPEWPRVNSVTWLDVLRKALKA